VHIVLFAAVGKTPGDHARPVGPQGRWLTWAALVGDWRSTIQGLIHCGVPACSAVRPAPRSRHRRCALPRARRRGRGRRVPPSPPQSNVAGPSVRLACASRGRTDLLQLGKVSAWSSTLPRTVRPQPGHIGRAAFAARTITNSFHHAEASAHAGCQRARRPPLPFCSRPHGSAPADPTRPGCPATPRSIRALRGTPDYRQVIPRSGEKAFNIGRDRLLDPGLAQGILMEAAPASAPSFRRTVGPSRAPGQRPAGGASLPCPRAPRLSAAATAFLFGMSRLLRGLRSRSAHGCLRAYSSWQRFYYVLAYERRYVRTRVRSRVRLYRAPVPAPGQPAGSGRDRGGLEGQAVFPGQRYPHRSANTRIVSCNFVCVASGDVRDGSSAVAPPSASCSSVRCAWSSTPPRAGTRRAGGIRSEDHHELLPPRRDFRARRDASALGVLPSAPDLTVPPRPIHSSRTSRSTAEASERFPGPARLVDQLEERARWITATSARPRTSP
jgi:hypothetical protein